MSNEPFDPVAASGEENFRGVRPLELNEVLLNGDDREGGYFRKRVLVGRTNRDEKPEEIQLTRKPGQGENAEPLKVVFLKIRRKLVERGKGGEIIRQTNEHNHKGEVVTLYDTKTREKVTGIASDLRDKYEGLRTVQVVYALLDTGVNEPELVRLTIKGASLGSDAKGEGVTSFYEYLQSFSGEDHFYNYKTLLQPVIERGAKTYYAIDFQRGERLSEKSQAFTYEKMQHVDERCRAVDAQRSAKIVKGATVEEDVEPEEGAGVDYPKDDINPDDIPF